MIRAKCIRQKLRAVRVAANITIGRNILRDISYFIRAEYVGVKYKTYRMMRHFFPDDFQSIFCPRQINIGTDARAFWIPLYINLLLYGKKQCGWRTQKSDCINQIQ